MIIDLNADWLNASLPILINEEFASNVTSVNDNVIINALIPILVTYLGMIIEVNDVVLSNTLSPILVNVESASNVTVRNAVAKWNA